MLDLTFSSALQNTQMHRMLLHIQRVNVISSPGVIAQSVQEPSAETYATSESEEWFDAPDVQPSSSLVSQGRTTPTSQSWQSRIFDADGLGNDQVLRVAGAVGMPICDPLCACCCHIRTPLETPRCLRDLCGQLFTSHIAFPWLSRRSCNLFKCKQSGKDALRVSYIFPTWLMRRMLVICMTCRDISGPGATWSIRMPRIVPYNAPIWTSIRFNRGFAVRFLLRTFQSSPFDIWPSGSTLLYVRNDPITHFASISKSVRGRSLLTLILVCFVVSSLGYRAVCNVKTSAREPLKC